MSTDAGAVGTERPPAPVADAAPVGAPNGGQVGAPLDLSTMSANGAHAPGGDRALPPPRVGGATRPQLATLPPSQTPRDEFDLAYGYVLRKEYPLAEQAFPDYLRRYPNDRMPRRPRSGALLGAGRAGAQGCRGPPEGAGGQGDPGGAPGGERGGGAREGARGAPRGPPSGAARAGPQAADRIAGESARGALPPH